MPLPPSKVEKLLLVEGSDDGHVTCHLYDRAGHDVDFGVEVKGDVEQVIRSIRNEARVSGRESLGIVVDANDQLLVRWQDISAELNSVGIQLPPQPVAGGAVVQPAQSGLPRVGVWLMPDNARAGELEDFLSGLVRPGDLVWPLTLSYVDDVHDVVPQSDLPKRSKSEVHAWLAAKNGGLPMGTSVGMGLFDIADPAAQTFLSWLQAVFV